MINNSDVCIFIYSIHYIDRICFRLNKLRGSTPPKAAAFPCLVPSRPLSYIDDLLFTSFHHYDLKVDQILVSTIGIFGAFSLILRILPAAMFGRLLCAHVACIS